VQRFANFVGTSQQAWFEVQRRDRSAWYADSVSVRAGESKP